MSCLVVLGSLREKGKADITVVLFQLIAGCHPYDQTVDMDAPGEEMEEELVAAERRKQTAAQSWKSFRASKGQGVLKVGQTDRDQVRSTMYDAAWSFAVSLIDSWGVHRTHQSCAFWTS